MILSKRVVVLGILSSLVFLSCLNKTSNRKQEFYFQFPDTLGIHFDTISVLLTMNSGQFVDLRDDETYNWIRLRDNNIWMADNLRYAAQCSWCYNDSIQYCNTNGRLYNWHTALSACPNGWRLATNEEWEQLIRLYGDETNAYTALIDGGIEGFAATLGGDRRPDGAFKGLNLYGSYWTSTKKGFFLLIIMIFSNPKAFFIKMPLLENQVILVDVLKIKLNCLGGWLR